MKKDNILEIKNLTKVYTDSSGFKVNLISEFDLTLETDKPNVILAPAGAGKTTLLKLITNLEKPDSGEIITQKNLNVAFIPSAPSSFPWLNTIENIMWGKNEDNSIDIEELVELLGLSGYEEHHPHNKSTGYRFRLVLGRAVVSGANFLLTDEPFENMDRVTARETLKLMIRVTEKYGIGFLLATTNISRALFAGNVIHIMKKNPGKIIKSFTAEFSDEKNRYLTESPDFISNIHSLENIIRESEEEAIINFSL